MFLLIESTEQRYLLWSVATSNFCICVLWIKLDSYLNQGKFSKIEPQCGKCMQQLDVATRLKQDRKWQRLSWINFNFVFYLSVFELKHRQLLQSVANDYDLLSLSSLLHFGCTCKVHFYNKKNNVGITSQRAGLTGL